MPADVLNTLGLLALGAACAGLIAVTYWYGRGVQLKEEEDADAAEVPKPPKVRRFAITVHHTHELSPTTIAYLNEAFVQAVVDLHAAQDAREQNRPKAQPFAMPDEPEARIQREMARAATVLRGAERLRAEAKERGLDLPMKMAMEQAATMYLTATDSN